MRDVRSSAGAVGLMQLMPETGRRTAKEFHLPYAGHVTLTDPDSNIQLGTAYLRKLLDRFDNNRVLATAAYNAGPLNVDKWEDFRKKMTDAEFANFTNLLDKLVQHAETSLDLEDKKEAAETWQEVLGYRFPIIKDENSGKKSIVVTPGIIKKDTESA